MVGHVFIIKFIQNIFRYIYIAVVCNIVQLCSLTGFSTVLTSPGVRALLSKSPITFRLRSQIN